MKINILASLLSFVLSKEVEIENKSLHISEDDLTKTFTIETTSSTTTTTRPTTTSFVNSEKSDDELFYSFFTFFMLML